MWFRFITAIDNLLERVKYWHELSKWEKQKRKEGFPKEWFVEDSKEYKGNPNFAGDD